MIPFSECCNEPIFIKINDNNIININCSSKVCVHPLIVEMLVGANEEIFDEQFNKAKKDEKITRKLISKYIITGKFRILNLHKEILKEKEKIKEKLLQKNHYPFILNEEKNIPKLFHKDLESFDQKLEVYSPIKAPKKLLDRYKFKVDIRNNDPIKKYKRIIENIGSV